MSNGEIDTTALIICVCVIIPALIALGVCAIIYFSHRKIDRKLHRQTNASVPYEYQHEPERPPQDAYVIDFTRVHRQQQQRRPRDPAIFEQSPPTYDTSVNQSRRQPVPLYSSIRTTPSSTNIRQTSTYITPSIFTAMPSTYITPSIYTAMPPSYAEIFLTPHTLPNV